MKRTDSHIPRRGALILIALFSCLQILVGLYLITGKNADDSIMPAPNMQSFKLTQLSDWEKY